jgi:hypothetical protein
VKVIEEVKKTKQVESKTNLSKVLSWEKLQFQIGNKKPAAKL